MGLNSMKTKTQHAKNPRAYGDEGIAPYSPSRLCSQCLISIVESDQLRRRWRWLGCVAFGLGGALTVAAAVIPSEPAHVQSLDGTWRFKLEQAGGYDADSGNGQRTMPVTTPTTFEPFQNPDYAEGKEWVDLKVPGNWEMAGHSPATHNQPDNASGFYRLWVEVPMAWKGRLVRLNFDGVQNGAEFWLNGQPVAVDEPSSGRTNYHEGG